MAMVTRSYMGGFLCKDAGTGACASLGIWSAEIGTWQEQKNGIRSTIGLLAYGSGIHGRGMENGL